MMLTFVLSMLLVSVTVAEDLSGSFKTQEGSTCEWKQVRYGETSHVQGFKLDCTCMDFSGKENKYSCIYHGEPGECFDKHEPHPTHEVETEFFEGIAIEARGEFCCLTRFATNDVSPQSKTMLVLRNSLSGSVPKGLCLL